MDRTLSTLAIVAAAALAGCDQQDHNIVAAGPYDPQANAANETVVLPPSIVSSHAYRCKDNSLVYITLLSDNKTALFRSEQTDPPTTLTAPEAGQPYIAEGYELVVTAGSRTVTLTRPDAGRQTCNA